MPLLARRSPLHPSAIFTAALALLLLIFLGTTAHADAATKKPVRAKVAKKTLTLTGDRRANSVVLRLKRRARGTLEVDVSGTRGVDYRFRRTRFNKILVRGAGGADTLRIDERNGVFTNTEKTTLRGDAGNDRITGGAGRESISAGAGNDTVDAGRGNDSIALGTGDDVVRSDPGEGGDRVKGDAGSDRIVVNGSAGDDALAASPNGPRLRITRGGALAFDADDVEAIDFSVLGGVDTITVGDLQGTDVRRTGADLAAAPGAGGDGAADSVVVNGSAGPDRIAVTGGDGTAAVNGLATPVAATGAEPGSDRLVVNGQGGDDSIDSSALSASAAALSADGGPGADSLVSGQGADVLAGGENDDTFTWAAGDGSDRIEGQGGSDRIAITGSDGGETIDASRAEGRVRIARDGETLDIDDVEAASINALGGADAIAVNDLGGTDLGQATIEAADGGADHVTVNGSAGADQLDVDGSDANVTVRGLLPAVDLHVDAGADNLTVNGQAGNDTVDATGLAAGLVGIVLNGGDDADTLLGSEGPDTAIGARGDDLAFLGAGDDTFRRGAGDGSDTVEGQAGAGDRLHVDGSDGNDTANLAPNGGRALYSDDGAADTDDVEVVEVSARGGTDSIVSGDLTGTDVKDVNVDLGEGARESATATATNGNETVNVTGDASAVTVTGVAARLRVSGGQAGDDGVTVNALGGGDVVDASTLPADALALTANGGLGGDTLLGGAGGDTFNGGDGTDVALMGAGDDTFVWNPGDDNDILEGQAGAGDKMVFNGANVAENIDVVANGGRVLFIRNVANVTMDLNDVENIDFKALGGADNVVVGDLSGTDVTSTDVDLGAGDNALDTVTANGTNVRDVVTAGGGASGVSVIGLPSRVGVTGLGPATDRLTLNGLGGNDVLDTTGLAADGLAMSFNGGLGNDVFLGGAGNDLFNGGDGDDVALMGAGDDTFVWNPGDDNDTLEGQAGTDRMLFNGANVAENITISANGGRVLFFRSVASVTMDLNDVEVVDLNALGGADNIVVNDLSGTDLTVTNLNLTANGGAGDAAADTVTAFGTSGDDVALAVGDASGVSVLGLASTINITGAEAANDRLTVNALAGDDVVEASGLAANAIALTADGGNDDDVLIGGDGNDTLLGGAGDDVLIGGPGTDTLDGGTGDNVVIQG